MWAIEVRTVKGWFCRNANGALIGTLSLCVTILAYKNVIAIKQLAKENLIKSYASKVRY